MARIAGFPGKPPPGSPSKKVAKEFLAADKKSGKFRKKKK